VQPALISVLCPWHKKKPHLPASPVLYGMVESGRYWRQKRNCSSHVSFWHSSAHLLNVSLIQLATQVSLDQLKNMSSENGTSNFRQKWAVWKRFDTYIHKSKIWQKTWLSFPSKTALHIQLKLLVTLSMGRLGRNVNC
jgi:hypothetical protein